MNGKHGSGPFRKGLVLRLDSLRLPFRLPEALRHISRALCPCIPEPAAQKAAYCSASCRKTNHTYLHSRLLCIIPDYRYKTVYRKIIPAAMPLS